MSNGAIEIPQRMKLLAIDAQRKSPVPWFVQWAENR